MYLVIFSPSSFFSILPILLSIDFKIGKIIYVCHIINPAADNLPLLFSYLAVNCRSTQKIMFLKNIIIISIILFSGIFASIVSAEEQATSTEAVVSAPTITSETAATSTAEIVSTPVEEPVVSTPPSEPAPASEPPPPQLDPIPSEPAPAPEPPPAETPSFEPLPQPIIPPGEIPVVPYTRTDGKAFDSAIAPSKVRLKILDNAGNAPTIPVFVSFVGVGGRNYGGPVDREGAIEVILPTGRYYADVLVIATNLGPPQNLPAFFLEANEERDFGVFTLTDKSSFADPVLENEIASTLDSGSGKGGFAKIFALIIKLLLAILREIRGLRSELLVR